jgi:hypothetical protein
MISQEHYKLLTIDAKAEILWKEGIFLHEIIDYGKYRVTIFELDKFFVGVYYSVKNNRIEKIEVLETDFKQSLLREISMN